jgi:polysaccharide biosynthesis transport protein
MKLQRGEVAPSSHESNENTPGLTTTAPASVPAFHDEQIIRLNILRALQLHRRLALGCAATGMLLAVAYAILIWPVYIAKSQIYVQPVQPKVMLPGNDQNGSINAAAYDAYVQQQVQSATSPAVLTSAIKKLGPGTWQRGNESEQAAAERLGHAIDAARVGTGYEVLISSRASDPVLSAKIANAVADSIAEKASGEGNAGDAQRITVLHDERDRIQNELKSDYAEQDDLNKQLGMAAVGPVVPDLIDDQISKTRDELIKAQTEHDLAEARFSAMKAGQSDASAAMNAEADDLIAADAGLSSMKTSLNQRRAALITQMANLTPQNPGYKLAADELIKINTSLDAMMNDLRSNAATRIQQKLRTDLERTARVEDQLNGQLRELARRAAGATPKLQRVNDLATDIVRLRNRFSIVDEQLHNLMVEDSAPGAVHVSVAAMPPLHPSFGKVLKGALPLALGGLLLGLLAAIVANKLDPHVYIGADLEQALGFAPMAVLPDLDEVSESVAAEYFMRLAASIEHAGRNGDLQTCVITGTARCTGVTTIAGRIRSDLTSMGRSAVLLNATGYPMLDSPEDEASKTLLKRVVSRADREQESLVLIDTAPLVLSAETEYLVRSVDGALVVIQSGVTTRAQLLAAVNTLQRLEVGAIGFVLNRVSLAKADPAFRRSLHEMEKHLRTQGASSSMWPVRWRGFVDEPPRKPEYAAHDHALPEHSEHAPEAADERASSTVYEFPKASAELPARPKPVLPIDAEMPWWLLPPSSRVKPEASVVETCAAEPVQTEYPDSAPPRIRAPKLPDWFWEGGTNGTGDFTRLAAEHAAAATEQIPLDSDSRLERLRGLFSNIGLANLSRNRGPFPPDEPQSSPITVTGSIQVNIPAVEPGPVVAPVEKAVEAVVAQQVFARPEILSPKEFVPIKVQKSRSDAASSTGWNDDEIRILPSKRGQYGSR